MSLKLAGDAYSGASLLQISSFAGSSLACGWLTGELRPIIK